MESESSESPTSASQFGIAGAWEMVTAALVSRIAIICRFIITFDYIRRPSFLLSCHFSHNARIFLCFQVKKLQIGLVRCFRCRPAAQ